MIFKTQHSFNPIFIKEIFVSKNNQYAPGNEHPIKRLRPWSTTFEGKQFFSWKKVVACTNKSISELESI